MAVKTHNPAALLRRPLPPKILSPLPSTCEKNVKIKNLSCKNEKRKGTTLLSKPRDTEIVCDFGRDKHEYFGAVVPSCIKPRGPDPLPARSPRHVREFADEVPSDGRFAPSSPLFTLADFLKKWDSASRGTEPPGQAMRIVLGKDDYDEARKRYELCRQEEVYRKIINADSAELPKCSPRKPQRQIIIELAAAILTNEGRNLDEKINAILEKVEVPTYQQPTRFLRGLHQPVLELPTTIGPSSGTVQEWSELSSLGVSDTSDIAYVLARNLYRKRTDFESTTDEGNTTSVAISKGDTCPQSEVLLSRSPTAYFQGTARCSSPFENDEEEQETLIAAAEFVILETILKCYTTLDLKAHFIAELPTIQPLRLQLTVVNLSFNNFRVFPPELFTLKNLVSLNLRNNPLKEIPFEIGQLIRLQTLVVSFCLVSSLPFSLFSLRDLKVLDLAYNKLSFIPNEIGNLRINIVYALVKHLNLQLLGYSVDQNLTRSLIEFSVEGNELGAFPTGFLKLRLKYLRMVNNFTNVLFWKETTSNQPQRLFHLAAQTVVSCSLLNWVPVEIKSQLLKPEVCDCCSGPVFGRGVRIIKTVEEIFGVKSLPLIFTVCSQTCRKAFKKNPEAVNNWLDKSCPFTTHA